MKLVFIVVFLLFSFTQVFAHEPFDLVEGAYEIQPGSSASIPELKIKSVGNGAYLLSGACVSYLGGHGCVEMDPAILRYVDEVNDYRAQSIRMTFNYYNISNTCTTIGNQIIVHQNNEGELFVQFRVADAPIFRHNVGCIFNEGSYSWRTQSESLIKISN